MRTPEPRLGASSASPPGVPGSPLALRASVSIPHRNAASVFPEPVGAQISVFAPAVINGQPIACAGVGASNEASNQRLTGAEHGVRADAAVAFAWVANPPILRIRRTANYAGAGHGGTVAWRIEDRERSHMLGKAFRRTRRKLEENGKRASAVVVEIAKRGMSVTSGNENIVSNTEVVLYDPQDHDKLMLDDSPAGAAVQFGDASGMGGMDMQTLMSKVKDAQSQTQDPQELARLLQDQLGTNVTVEPPVESTGVTFGSGFGNPAQAPAEEDPVDKLAKLAELKEKGMLTDSEFESQKARILSEG